MLVFSVSDGAQASINRVVQKSGTGALDFSDVVLYTVSNADYSVKTRWRVVVTNNDYTARYGMGNFLTASWSNNGTAPGGFYMPKEVCHTSGHNPNLLPPSDAGRRTLWLNGCYASRFFARYCLQ